MRGPPACLHLVLLSLATLVQMDESEVSEENCHVPLGVSNSYLMPTFWLSASDGLAFNGRLNRGDAWRSTKLLFSELKTTKKDPRHYAWMQIDLLRETLVTGIQTRGDPNADNWVTMFSMSASPDCENFTPLLGADGQIAVFHGNYDSNSTVTNILHDVVATRCIKVVPLKMAGNMTALRLELLGCDVKMCEEAVIEHLMEETMPDITKPDMPDSETRNRSASDSARVAVTSQVVPPRVLLTSPTIITRGFAEFKFPAEQVVFGVVFHSPPKVKSRREVFIITHSRNCHQWHAVREKKGYGDAKVFLGYTGRYRTKWHRFPYPVRAQCMRIIPKTNRYISLQKPIKAHFIGCGTGAGVLGQCGQQKHLYQSHRQKRVIGGVPSDPGLWPWMASLQIKDTSGSSGHVCGGTLIHPQFILTAAHCIRVMYSLSGANMTRNFSLWNGETFREVLQVRLGEHSLTVDEGTHLDRDVEEIIIHPDYNISYYLNDIALIKLALPVPLTDHVGLVCLPSSDSQFNNQSVCKVTGWGRTRTGFPGRAHHGNIPLITNDDCQLMYSHLTITDDMQCAGLADASVDACVGDSGGPLVCEDENNHWYQVGVASWNIGCGLAGYPSVFAKVALFVDWIHDVITERT